MHSGKFKSSHTQVALRRKRRTPTEGYTTAAWGNHRYDVRTLEADKPAAASSVPLIWMFSRPSDADVNIRFGDSRPYDAPLFSRSLYTCLRCHSVGEY